MGGTLESKHLSRSFSERFSEKRQKGEPLGYLEGHKKHEEGPSLFLVCKKIINQNNYTNWVVQFERHTNKLKHNFYSFNETVFSECKKKKIKKTSQNILPHHHCIFLL